MKKRWYFVAAAGAAAAVLVASVPGAVAFASAKPVVLSVFADPYRVPASASPVVSTVAIGQVKNAAKCFLTVVRQSSPAPVIVKRLPPEKNCARGDYRGQVDLYNNPTSHERWVELLLHADGATGPFYITQYAGAGGPSSKPPTSTTTTTAPFPAPATTTTTVLKPCYEGCAVVTLTSAPAPTSTTAAPTTTTVAPSTTVAPTTSTTHAATTTTVAPTTTTVAPTTTTVPVTTTTTHAMTTTTVCRKHIES